MNRQVPWLRVFVEGVVIVASILMAFGIERWWDGRQEADAEADYLQRVSADLDANVRIFQQQLLDWETSARAAAALLGLLEGTTHRPTDSGLAIDCLISFDRGRLISWRASEPSGYGSIGRKRSRDCCCRRETSEGATGRQRVEGQIE